MKQELILLPVIAMASLTAIVWIRLYIVRIRELRMRSMSPQKLASRRDGAQLLQDTRASDNFMNLFELPVLFYVLCLALYALGVVDSAYLWLATFYAGCVTCTARSTLLTIGYCIVLPCTSRVR